MFGRAYYSVAADSARETNNIGYIAQTAQLQWWPRTFSTTAVPDHWLYGRHIRTAVHGADDDRELLFVTERVDACDRLRQCERAETFALNNTGAALVSSEVMIPATSLARSIGNQITSPNTLPVISVAAHQRMTATRR